MRDLLVCRFLSNVKSRGNITKQFLCPHSLQLLGIIQSVGCLEYLDADKLLWVLSTVESHEVGGEGAKVMFIVSMTLVVCPSETHWLFSWVIGACSASIVGPLAAPQARITSQVVDDMGTRPAVCCLRYSDGVARHRWWRHKLREDGNLTDLAVASSVGVTMA